MIVNNEWTSNQIDWGMIIENEICLVIMYTILYVYLDLLFFCFIIVLQLQVVDAGVDA